MKMFARDSGNGRHSALADAALGLLFCFFVMLIAPPFARAAAADSPFLALSGSWGGTGTIAMSSGAKERIRCRASYRLENPVNLRLEMSCSSDSYRFELH